MDSLAATVTKCVSGKDLLREDAPTRESAAKKLAALQSQMSAFMGAA